MLSEQAFENLSGLTIQTSKHKCSISALNSQNDLTLNLQQRPSSHFTSFTLEFFCA